MDVKKRKLVDFPGFSASVAAIEPWVSSDPRQIRLETKLAAMFACSRLSLNFITDAFFRDFVHELSPKFVLPKSVGKIKFLIENVFTSMRQSVQKVTDQRLLRGSRLAQGQRTAFQVLLTATSYSVLLDMWTQRGFKYSYVGVVLVFFNPATASVESVLLGVRLLNHPHTSDRIRSIVDILLSIWDLRHEKVQFLKRLICTFTVAIFQVMRYVTDGGSNMVCAYKYDKLMVESCEDDGEDEESYIADSNLDSSFDEEAEVDRQLAAAEKEIESLSISFPHRISCFVHSLICVLKKCVEKDEEVCMYAARYVALAEALLVNI